MSEREIQLQHRISKIYLKQFGFKEGKKWKISIWRKGTSEIDIQSIEVFSSEENIFDLPYSFSNGKRHFENTSSIIESHYGEIIKGLKRENKLTPAHKDLLCHFVANFICRAKPYREYFDSLLNDEKAKEKLLQEITLFYGDRKEEILLQLSIFASKDHLNILIGYIMNHLVYVFRGFEFVILRDYQQRGWFSTDNPVVIDNQDIFSWIIPLETEIYFPLSKDFCLFLFHKNSEKQGNSLRLLSLQEVINTTEEQHTFITNMILSNCYECLILPAQIPKTDLKDVA